MRYHPLPSAMFIDHRNFFKSQLEGQSLAVFVSNDQMPTNADGSMGFKQNSDLFYLCGIDQEETLLVVFSDAFTGNPDALLFIRETNAHIAVWEGEKLSIEAARQQSGIAKVYWMRDFDSVMRPYFFQAQHIYLNENEHTRRSIDVETRQSRFNRDLKAKLPLHNFKRCAPIMHRIRAVKTAHEMEYIQQACNITEMGFRRLLTFLKPGVFEYELEAELIHEFIRNRANGFAYGPIIASGKNACVLHYVENTSPCQDGDLVLIDAAAEYANYASDLTRCIPVNGRFSKRQKAVYDAVLRVHRFAASLLVPGQRFDDFNTRVGECMTEELLQLNLLKSADVKAQTAVPAYKKYFMHGTSHFLGLDVHDVGYFHEPIKAGMVFTVEPGIYIPEEGLGIRIENNFMVTTTKPLDLMQNIPIETEAIEALMAKR